MNKVERKLWVVEMLITDFPSGEKRWDSTVGVALTREYGREQLKKWRNRNPNDEFRLTKYAPFEKEEKIDLFGLDALI